ncbi:hypothetical protein LTR17_010041 [Elasticomyces elasticus]|nr:hypothetical protein LTR17_010041 [Elasticomyces elasticus]
MTAFTEFLRLFIGLSPSPQPTPDADHFLGALRPRRALKNPARLPNTPTLSHRPALKKVQKRTSKPKAFKCPNSFYDTETNEERMKRLGKLNRMLSLYPPRPIDLRPRITRPERFADLTFPKHVPAAPKRKAIKKKQTAKKQQTTKKQQTPKKQQSTKKQQASESFSFVKKQQTATEQQASPTFSFEYPPNAIIRRFSDGTTVVTDPQGTFESLGCGPRRQ